MSNTNPELRADKNGKLVTRHVSTGRTNRGLPSWANMLPVQPVMDETMLRSKIAKSFGLHPLNSKIAAIPTENLKPMVRLVSQHDWKMFENDILEAAASFTPENFKNVALVLKRHHDTASSILARAPKDTLEMQSHELMLVTGMLRHEFRMTKAQQSILITAICRIWITDAMNDSDALTDVFPTRPEGRYDQKAVDNSTMREDLAKFIVDHPEDMDAIVGFVVERKISDPVDIAELLDIKGSSALSNGAL